MTEPKALPCRCKEFKPGHVVHVSNFHPLTCADCGELIRHQSVLSPLEDVEPIVQQFAKYFFSHNYRSDLEQGALIMIRDALKAGAITFSPKSEGLMAFTREDIVELHNAFQYRKNVSPNNYEMYKNEIIDTFIARFGTKPLIGVKPTACKIHYAKWSPIMTKEHWDRVVECSPSPSITQWLFEALQAIKQDAQALSEASTRPQRQDSLTDQMATVIDLARDYGCYDAGDWIKRTFMKPRKEAETREVSE